MITPNNIIINNSYTSNGPTFTQAVTYPATANTFSLVAVPAVVSHLKNDNTVHTYSSSTPLATINATTGVLTIKAANPGAYEFLVKYKIGSQFYTELFTVVVNDYVGLSKSTFVVCVNEDKTDCQLSTENGLGVTWSKLSGATQIEVTSGGVLTYTPEEGETANAKTCVVNYSVGGVGVRRTVTLNMIVCTELQVSQFTECPKEPITIVWLNSNTGARDSYMFSQTKSYEVSQKDAIQFINSNNELRYADRGDVYNIIEVTNQLIPKEHINKIGEMMDSLQCYIMDIVDDAPVFTPVLIEQGNYKKYFTEQEAKEISFKMLYAVKKTIQAQ